MNGHVTTQLINSSHVRGISYLLHDNIYHILLLLFLLLELMNAYHVITNKDNIIDSSSFHS